MKPATSIAQPLPTHYSFDGFFAALESCRHRGPVTTDPAKVTCKRCLASVLQTVGNDATRQRIREGYLTPEQLRAALARADRPYAYAAILVAYFCALRATEVGLLKFSKLDLARGTLDFQRMKKSLGGIYELSPGVLAALKEWLRVRPRESEWLFPKPGEPRLPLNRRSFSRMWATAARRAGLSEEFHHPHVLKHSIITHMLDRGDDIMHVKKWAGHKDIQSTLIYAELTGRSLREGQNIANTLVDEITKGPEVEK